MCITKTNEKNALPAIIVHVRVLYPNYFVCLCILSVMNACTSYFIGNILPCISDIYINCNVFEIV